MYPTLNAVAGVFFLPLMSSLTFSFLRQNKGGSIAMHWSELSPNGKLYLVLSPNWAVSRLYLKPPMLLPSWNTFHI